MVDLVLEDLIGKASLQTFSSCHSTKRCHEVVSYLWQSLINTRIHRARRKCLGAPPSETDDEIARNKAHMALFLSPARNEPVRDRSPLKAGIEFYKWSFLLRALLIAFVLPISHAQLVPIASTDTTCLKGWLSTIFKKDLKSFS